MVRFGKAAGRSDETGAFLLRRLPAGKGELVVDAASLPPDLRAVAPRAFKLGEDPAAVEDANVPVLPAGQ